MSFLYDVLLPSGIQGHRQHVSWAVASKTNRGGCHSRRVLPAVVQSTGQTRNAEFAGKSNGRTGSAQQMQ